jgi:hypothetical protein
MSVMALEVALKKPLCIDSNVVHRIDRVFGELSNPEPDKFESVLSCNQYKIEKFSAYFSSHQAELNRKLGRAELMMSGLGPVKPIKIQIVDTEMIHPKVSPQSIVISSDSLESKSFEAALLQAALLQKTKGRDESTIKLIADFLSGAYVAKNDYVADLWMRSFEALSAFEKAKFKLEVQRNLKQIENFADDSSIENVIALLSAQSGADRIKQVFSEHLHKAQLLGENSDFDLVVHVQDVTQINLKELQSQTKINLKKVALQTENAVYVLPYMVPLNDQQASRLKSNLRLIITSQNILSKTAREFSDSTEHLLVVKSEDTQKLFSLNYSALFKDWKQFVAANADIQFVKFHMPSLKYVERKTQQRFSFQQLFSTASVSKIGPQSLGWTEVQWDQVLKAYKPVALYDAVQFYRLN